MSAGQPSRPTPTTKKQVLSPFTCDQTHSGRVEYVTVLLRSPFENDRYPECVQGDLAMHTPSRGSFAP